jgi:hypothetical protein
MELVINSVHSAELVQLSELETYERKVQQLGNVPTQHKGYIKGGTGPTDG